MKTKILGLALILSMLLAACSGGEESSMPEADQSAMAEVSAEASNEESTESNVSEETSEDASTESSIAEDEPSTEPDAPANQNLLTGLADLSQEGIGKRPVAIMVNNIPAAMPQYGIDKADVVFEIPVEGYQTRLMCIFADYTKIPQVCSVRSCRKYFPAIALGFDAVYVNCGQNKAINDYVNSLGITQYDGGKDKNGIFVRDQERLNAGYATEHTLYFDAPRFPEILEKDGVDMNLSETKVGTAFQFAPMGEEITPNGEACVDVFVDFGSCEAGFTYNEETKTYFKTYWDKNENSLLPQCDGKSGKQFEFKNLIVLHNDYALDDSAVYDPARNRKHRLIDWKGGKDCEAYYISNGVKQQIYWEKDSEQSYMKFFDMEGNELAINRGKTYICFNEMDDVEFK